MQALSAVGTNFRKRKFPVCSHHDKVIPIVLRSRQNADKMVSTVVGTNYQSQSLLPAAPWQRSMICSACLQHQTQTPSHVLAQLLTFVQKHFDHRAPGFGPVNCFNNHAHVRNSISDINVLQSLLNQIDAVLLANSAHQVAYKNGTNHLER